MLPGRWASISMRGRGGRQVLEVYLHGQLVGMLREKDNGNLQFRYTDAYIEENGPPLSLNMPVRSEAYPHRDCLAYFGNLLPEEDVRAQLALAVGISASNDYRLLDRFGGDVAGAVTLIDPGAPEQVPVPSTLEVLDEARLDELLFHLPQRPLGADEKGEIRLSLAGAQNKLPVVETKDGFALPHGSALPTTHILKPEPERLPGLVGNEFFCMRLAEAADLPVSRVERAVTTSGLPYLIVERYDRDLTQEPIRRLHQEDLCQALGKLQSEKYQDDGGPTVRQAFELIDRHSSAPIRDRPQMWMALVFNALIGNCDAHGKNYSFLYDTAAPSLAPLYDLVSTVVYDNLTTRLAMSINGARRLEEVNRSCWDDLAEAVGVAKRFVAQRMEPFVDRVTALAGELAARPEHDDPIVAEIVRGIEQRSKAILR